MAIELEVLRRAYELHCTTDLTIAEIERALVIRKGTLERALEKECNAGPKRITSDEMVFDYLKSNGERRTDEIQTALDLTLRCTQAALQRLAQSGRVVTGRCRVDRRIKSHRIAKWYI